MESSEEEDDEFPSIETITPQSNIDSLYQSHTEKGIRRVCCELLDLKDSVDNLCGNMRTKYLAFLRLSEEVVEMEHEMMELRKHISAEGIIVQDLLTGVFHELEEWTGAIGDIDESSQLPPHEMEDPQLENIDILLAEHRIVEAIEAFDAAEARNSTAFLERKAKLEDQLVKIIEQPSLGITDMKISLSGLIKLGKGPLAHQLLLKSYASRLQNGVDVLLPSSSVCPKVFPASISRLVFSTISSATKESGLIFGENPVYTNRVIQWAEWEIESFVRLVKENAPSSETLSALRAASVCVESSLSHCSMLESQGLKLSKLLLVLLRPYIEQVLELNFRRARKMIFVSEEIDESVPLSSHFSALSVFATSSDIFLVDSGMKFMHIVEEMLEQLTPSVIVHFGGNLLTRISQLFGRYSDALIRALPGPSDDDSLTELKEAIPFRAETDSQQLAILGIAFTIIDELLVDAVRRIWNTKNERKDPGNESSVSTAITAPEMKELKRQLLHSFDKLRDHFCRQYVLNFIYSREGKTRLNGQIYLNANNEDLYWDSDPLPSLPFQALFAKLQQLATVAGDVLLGKDKLQKILLARLTETVVIWLSDEQEFWSVFEDECSPLQPLGLQQLILDMHFTVEIARFAGYPSRQVHQIASAIIARAIRTCAARGIEPQSALPEDEWFVETAKSAINKLLLGGSGSEASDMDENHIILDDDNDDDLDVVSDSADTASSLSTVESTESFASASMGELESPNFTDPEA